MLLFVDRSHCLSVSGICGFAMMPYVRSVRGATQCEHGGPRESQALLHEQPADTSDTQGARLLHDAVSLAYTHDDVT